MRRVAYGVVGVLAFIAQCHITNRLGREWGWGLLVGLTLLPHSTERARGLIGLFRRHLERHLSMKAAAITMGQSQPQLTNAFAGREHLHFDRAAELPDSVWLDFCQDFLEGHGYVVVVPSGRLASATSALLRLSAAVEAQAPVTYAAARSGTRN